MREIDFLLDGRRVDDAKESGAERVRLERADVLGICLVGVEGGVMSAGAVWCRVASIDGNS